MREEQERGKGKESGKGERRGGERHGSAVLSGVEDRVTGTRVSD